MIKIQSGIEMPIRLDRYLKKLYPLMSQGVIEKGLRLKQITVNSSKAIASLRINKGDEILISESFKLQTFQDKSPKIFSNSVLKLADKIMSDYKIYEDQDLIAINKPSGLAVQSGSKIKLSIDDALQYLNTKKSDLKLVHRLDKDTSGVLLLAKNHVAATNLMQAFKNHLIKKTYYAVTIGKPKVNSGEISGTIGKNRDGAYEIVQNCSENGKLAITKYEVIKNLKNNFHLIEFTPLTGRMHQLRFHAKLLGAPIIGDIKYGNNSIESSKMLLHAKEMLLSIEIFGREISISSELPKYYKNFLKTHDF